MTNPTGRLPRVAVTGAGVVTPIGTGLDAFVESLQTGRQGVSSLTEGPVPRGKAAAGLVTEQEFEGPDRAFRMAKAAISEALRGADIDVAIGKDIALIVSTIAGDSRAAENLYPHFSNATVADKDLLYGLSLYPNGRLLNSLGDAFGFLGPRLVVTNACASGNIALGLALDMVRLGRCRVAIVIGVEIVKLSMIWGAERAGFVGRVLRPFHRDRDGSVLGEGAAALVVEHPDRVRRGQLLGWLEGFGCVCDRGAAPITLLDDGSGLRRSMGLALEDAGRLPTDLQYINAHAPGTRMIDLIECKAAAELCGDHATSVDINATKSMTTHLSGASGVLEVIATLLQMRYSFLHPTAGLDEPDPELALVPIGPESVSLRVTRALSNACGGGGVNTSVVVTAPEEPEANAGPMLQQDSTRIAITGIGSVSLLGAGTAEPLAAMSPLLHSRSSRLDWFNIYRWYGEDTSYAYMNRAAQLAAAAGAIALSDSSLDLINGPYEDDRIAVVAGTHLGGGPEASEVMCRGLLENPRAIKPSMSLDHGLHLGAALVSRYFGLTGSTYTITGTTTASLQGVAIARDLLISGRADAAIVLGYDALDQSLQQAVSLLGDCPQVAKLGEGSGAIVLERIEAAEARHARKRSIVHHTALLSGSFSSAASVHSLAEILAAQLAEMDWDVIYLAASLEPRLDFLAERLLSVVQKSATVRRLQSCTNHCLAADSLIAAASSVVREERAVILAAETGGTVATVVVGPC